jgi:hypothetical protein
MLSMSSESESVLTCRWASASRNWRNEGVLMRLPFCLSAAIQAETYVSQHNAIWRVDIERLGLCMSRTACSRVSHCPLQLTDPVSSESLTVSHTHPALETGDRRTVHHVPDHTVRFDLVESPALSAGNDTCRILAPKSLGYVPSLHTGDSPVLEERQPIGSTR